MKIPQYTLRNLTYTIEFALWVRKVPLTKFGRNQISTFWYYLLIILFITNQFFSDFQNRRRCIGPIRVKPAITAVQGMVKSYSVTLLTSLADDDPSSSKPGKIQLCPGFCGFPAISSRGRIFVAGDIVVLDNAAVHAAHNAQDILLQMIEDWGVQFKFLPTYSPEFNPCELAFALVKKFLRSKVNLEDFLFQIFIGFSLLTKETIGNFYRHSVDFLFVNGFSMPPVAF